MFQNSTLPFNKFQPPSRKPIQAKYRTMMASLTFSHEFCDFKDTGIIGPGYQCFQSTWRLGIVLMLPAKDIMATIYHEGCRTRAKYLLKIDGSVHLGEHTWENDFQGVDFSTKKDKIRIECTLWIDEILEYPFGMAAMFRSKYQESHLTDFNVIVGSSIISDLLCSMPCSVRRCRKSLRMS